ncbi:MAG: hypothetical protein ABNH33_10325, partial [Glaciecola sp.]
RQVQSMSEGDILKCMKAAYYFIGKYNLPIEGEDLLNEAIVRILEGKRHLPRDVQISTAINQIMKSISYEMITKRSDEAMRNTTPLDEISSVSSMQDSTATTNDQQWSYILSLFKEDETASAFLAATEQGLKKSKIIEDIYGGDEKAYDTTRRRIIRKAASQIKESM